MKVEIISIGGLSVVLNPDEFCLLEDGYHFYYFHSGEVEPNCSFIEKGLVASFRVKNMEVSE